MMKKNRCEALLDYMITNSGTFVPAMDLACYLDVSPRQIRTYISELNNSCDGFVLIESGNKGYFLNPDNYYRYKSQVLPKKESSPQSRQNYIIQKLVHSKEGYNCFDFSEELFVSLPTIENDMKSVRHILHQHGLTLKRNRDLFFLEGTEKNKRNLMQHLITSDSYDNFILKDEVRLLIFHYHFWDFRKNIRGILTECDIFVNDYSLNNIALHLIVMIDRIRNNCTLQEFPTNDDFTVLPQYHASKRITAYIQETYRIAVNKSELYSLTLIIANNTTIMDYSSINSSNLHRYIEQKYIDIANDVLRKAEQCYYLDPFDPEFTAQFTIHIKNIFYRVENNYFAKNPLTHKVKSTYPLIYDIAVFIAQELDSTYRLHINEDEIAYISFHIGSYFENNVQNKNRVTCLFLYADYYSTYKHVLDKITRILDDKIRIKYAISVNQYQPEMVHADLIISTVDMPFSTPSIVVNPLLTERDITNIRESVEHLNKLQKNAALKAYLLNFVERQLFYCNAPYKDSTSAITMMTQDAIRLGFANPTFTHDVLAREAMSSTAFGTIAVPHSLSKNACSSFISFFISKKPMVWNNSEVFIIALIGVSRESRKIFSEVFDHLIDILSEPKSVKKLALSDNYNTFIHTLTQLMDEVE